MSFGRLVLGCLVLGIRLWGGAGFVASVPSSVYVGAGSLGWGLFSKNFLVLVR